MELHGKEYSVRELRKRVGNMDQLAGIRTVELQDGNERPTRAAIIHTGSGVFLRGDERIPFEPGDALFVAAGVEHRFTEFSDDFGAWVVFYGPEGGE